MDPVERDSVVEDATTTLVRQWGISPDVAMNAMSVSAAALGLRVEDLAALVSASSRLRRTRRLSVVAP